MNTAFQFKQYTLKRQVFALTGKFRIYASNDQLVLFSQQKMFKLKEDIRVFSDESMTEELLRIQARQIIDFAAAYDVMDPVHNTKIGTLRRKGFRSILRDEWEVLDVNDQPVGKLIEDDPKLAILRRFLGGLIPQNYDLLIHNNRVADLRQQFNIFRYELNLDFSMDTANQLDRRLGVAAGILLAAIEGKQKN